MVRMTQKTFKFTTNAPLDDVLRSSGFHRMISVMYMNYSGKFVDTSAAYNELFTKDFLSSEVKDVKVSLLYGFGFLVQEHKTQFTPTCF